MMKRMTLNESNFGQNLLTMMNKEFSKVSNNIDNSYDYKSISDFSDTKDSFKKNIEEDEIMDKPIGKIFTKGKIESKEQTSSASSGAFVGPTTTTKREMGEKWSKKYKDSIDCKNPKGFSQRAHCQGKKKLDENQKLKGGKSDNMTLIDILEKHSKKHKNLTIDILKKQLNKGIKVEMEHTDDRNKAKEIAMDHISENPKYYDKLDKIEKVEFKEATASASSGSYVTPAAWAKSTSKKDWRGKSKTLFPGGKFVTVKKKCKKFPYCNQGDINAIKFTNEGIFKKTISHLSKKYNISEQMIEKMIINHYSKIK